MRHRTLRMLLLAFAAHHLWRPRLPGRLSLPAALAVAGLGGLAGRPEGLLAATVAVTVALVLRHQRRGEAPLLAGIMLVAVAGFPLADDGELPAATVREAFSKYGIDTKKPNPVSV